ncbi:MAG: hypothetical protein R3231_13070 [bacterium]|nr:hypothetical protein [bacterium]
MVTLSLLLLQAVSADGGQRFPLTYISPETDRSILKAEQLTMEGQYSEARAIFDGMEKENPGRLLPGMGRMILILVQFMEKESPKMQLEEAFRAEALKNRSRIDTLGKQDNLTPWEHFVLGGTLGAQGLFDLEQGRYFRAFTQGLKALSHFKAARRRDPEIKDVHFALGLYKYYRSVKTRYLWFLPLVRDQREEGIGEIKIALAEGHYAVPAGKIALVLLAEREGDDRAGIALGKTYLLEYPRCRLIRDAVVSMERRLEAPTGGGPR